MAAAKQTLYARAEDGVRLAIHRLPSASGRGPAVVLQHGLAACHRAFHLPQRSLAVWLAGRGYDCYLPDLRGAGRSERPRGTWDLDDYLDLDIPAVLREVREASGQERVHWIGHSLGGLLLLCYGILHPDAPIASGLAIGSALDYRVGHTDFRALLRLRPLLKRLRFLPYGGAMRLVSPMLGRHAGARSRGRRPGVLRRPFHAMVCFNMWPTNIEGEVCAEAHASVFGPLSVPLLSSLATAFDPGGLRNRDGSVRFVESSRRFRVPLLLLAGTRDAQASVQAVRHTAGLVGGRAETRVYGRDHGQRDEYGHWDLILGSRAEGEVWPDIQAWLAEHTSAPAHER